MRRLLVLLVFLLPAAPTLAEDGTSFEERILLIGDSHVTSTFGKALDLLLRTRVDTNVTTVGSCGVTPAAFLDGRTSKCGILKIKEGERADWEVVATRGRETPRIDVLLDDAQPTLTIVELGANQLHTAYRDPKGAIVEARTLAEQIVASGSQCLWVGPPAGRSAQKPRHKIHYLYWVLEEAVGDLCHFTDSRPSSLAFLDYERVTEKRRRKGDGRHFDAIGVVGQEMARRWALTVFDQAQHILDGRHPEPLTSHDDCKEIRASTAERLDTTRYASKLNSSISARASSRSGHKSVAQR